MSVLLIGTSMLDRYIQCDFSKIDQAAPVPCGRHLSTFNRPGGAGNTFANLIALGVPVRMVTYLGVGLGPESGLAELQGQLDFWEKRAVHYGLTEYRPIVVSNSGSPIIKNRIIDAQGRMVARFDQEDKYPREMALQEDAILAVEDFWQATPPSVVVLSDYGKWLIRPALITHVMKRAYTAGVPVIVDPCPRHVRWYAGASWVTPNESQAEEMSQRLGRDLRHSPRQTAEVVRKRAGIANVLVTLGRHGMLLHSETSPDHTSEARGQMVVDATGAGDTVVAALADALQLGLSPEQAVDHANRAASIVVTKPGTDVAHRAELWKATVADDHNLKITTAGHAAQLARTAQLTQAKKVVVVNGCFDLLHDGHRHLLRHAHQAGELLIVLVNDDNSVHRLKGEGRPVQNLQERMRALAWTRETHLIVPFGEDKPTPLLRQIHPDYVLRGVGAKDPYEDRALLETWGGQVILVPDQITSTSELIHRAGARDERQTTREPG